MSRAQSNSSRTRFRGSTAHGTPSIRSFVRSAPLLLTSSLFSNLDPVYQVLLVLLAGGVALSGHAAKAATRLAVNHSPEPFSNVAVSLAEDAAVGGGLYLLVKHPWVMAGIAVGFLLLFAWLAPRVFRALRAEWTTFGALLRSWFGEVRKPQLRPAEQQWLGEHWNGRAPRQIVRGDRHSRLEGYAQPSGHPVPGRPGGGVLFSEVGTSRGAPDRSADCHRD